MGIEDWTAYTSAADKYAKKYGKKQHQLLHQYAFVLSANTRDKKQLQKAEQWVNQALTIQHQATYLRTKSIILQKLGRDKEAQELLQKAAEQQPRPRR